MDKLNSMTAHELSKLNIQGITISEPYGTLIGEPERNAVMFIWGEKGAGKSTFSLGLANALAAHGRVEYIPAEEHFGKTLVDRVKRLGATHDNLHFTKWKSVEALKDTLGKNNSAFCVLDSITVIDANDHATVELAQWCREAGIGFIMVAHATKDGRYKGNTSIAHECDIEIKVTKEGVAETEKNRYRNLSAVDVPFTAADMGAGGAGSIKPLTENQHLVVSDSLSNDEYSTDEELVAYWTGEYGLSGDQAKHWIAKRGRYLTDPTHEESRENPVDVPFRMSLKEIDKLHKFRSWRRINSLMGSKLPCYAKQHSGESDTGHFSIRYTPDYRRKKYTIELLLDGRLEHQVCTEGARGSFKQSWKQIVEKYGDIEVMIYSQDHAKKVLGAKEYKKQERAFAKTRQKEDSPKEKIGQYNLNDFTLPGEPSAYFKMPKEAQLLHLDDLEFGEDNYEDSIKNALGYMRLAADGKGKKRAPISVRKQGDSYLVLDGNATSSAAKRAGWKTIPAIVEPDETKKSKVSKTRTSKKSKPKKKKKPPADRKKPTPKAKTDAGGIDVEAARKSQSKLDSFLEKVLS